MKLKKSAPKKEYSKLLKGFDKAKKSYKESKAHKASIEQALKTDIKHLSNVDIKALTLLIEQAKYVSKAEKVNVKIAKLLIKQWAKAGGDAASESKKGGSKSKNKAESVETAEAAEAPAPKKRGRQPKAKVEVVEAAEVVAPKKRGRQPKAKVEAVEVVEVAPIAEVAAVAEAPAPKKRGRQPKPKVEAVEGAEAVETVEAAPKKTRQKKEKVEAIVAVQEPSADVAPKRRGRQPKVAVEATAETEAVAEVEEGVAGVSARAMEAADAPVAETREKKPRRSREEIAAQKTAEADAQKAALKGDDFKIIEGVGPKVTALLHDNGIFSFQDLAEKSYDELKALMMANRQYLAKPHNWAQQAQLAADGKMEELEALKATLKGGV